jgi:hypothetical protein
MNKKLRFCNNIQWVHSMRPNKHKESPKSNLGEPFL